MKYYSRPPFKVCEKNDGIQAKESKKEYVACLSPALHSDLNNYASV